MAEPALSVQALINQAVLIGGYERAAAELARYAPPARPAPRRGGMRPVHAIAPAVAPAPGSIQPAQRKMPFLAAVDGESPRLSREDTMTARRRILNDARVTRAGKAVARALFRHQWYGKTECWPGYKCMAQAAGTSERTIARGMANLIDCQYVARHRRGRLGHPKGGRRSNRYSLQLEFCFGSKPINPAKRPDDSNGQDSATVGMTAIEPGGRDNRKPSTPQTPLTGQSKATPVRQGGGDGSDGPPCPRCGKALTIDRHPEGTFFQCPDTKCFHRSFTPSQLFARVGNYRDNLAYKRRKKAGSSRAVRTSGDPYADRRAGS